MKATDIKMYISTLSIIKKGQEIECGDFLGGRKVNASQEDALNNMKNAVYSRWHWALTPVRMFRRSSAAV